jgi:hypothetical protein
MSQNRGRYNGVHSLMAICSPPEGRSVYNPVNTVPARMLDDPRMAVLTGPAAAPSMSDNHFLKGG